MTVEYKATFADLETRTIIAGESLSQIIERYNLQDDFGRFDILAAIVNNVLVDLNYKVNDNCTIRFVTLNSDIGLDIYRRGTVMVLSRAVRELFANSRLQVGISLGNSYYFDFETDVPVNDQIIELISERMNQIVKSRDTFSVETYSCQDAQDLFRQRGLLDKYLLAKHFEAENLDLVFCKDFVDIYHGILPLDTGYISSFCLRRYANGFVLCFPEKSNPQVVSQVIERHKLLSVFQQSKKWSRILEVNNIGRLNEIVSKGKSSEFIRIAEALHEKRIADIADEITRRSDEVRLVLIAGPSSSGKTTFSKRLQVHLMVNGLKPVTLGMDDYFVNREQNPVDENGNFDYESIYSLDLKLFNSHLVDLLQGKEVDLPKFDFESGKRSSQSKKLRINDDQILIIEGIHGLNEILTSQVPGNRKFKVYISALTQLLIDDFNRISTTDTRLIRRTIRDNNFRSYSALSTLSRWPSVRKGEERNIFPFQEQADVMFNSSLFYELAVMKKHALPLFSAIPPVDSNYPAAQRLLFFFSLFKDIEDTDVPGTSILREFIGKSAFNY